MTTIMIIILKNFVCRMQLKAFYYQAKSKDEKEQRKEKRR